MLKNEISFTLPLLNKPKLVVLGNIIYFSSPASFKIPNILHYIPGMSFIWNDYLICFNVHSSLVNTNYENSGSISGFDSVGDIDDLCSFTYYCRFTVRGIAKGDVDGSWNTIDDNHKHKAACDFANYILEETRKYQSRKNIKKEIFVTNEKYDQMFQRIDTFWKSKEEYKKYGLKHRRGILLYGPPGTGKTSFISEVIKKYPDAEVFYSIGHSHYSEDDREKQKYIYFLDEIEQELEEGSSRADFLKRIESVPENSLILATTNMPEALDQAFFNRPGRFEEIVRCEYPNYEYKLEYLKSKNSGDLIEYTDGLNFSHINELIYRVKINNEDPKTSHESLKEMAKTKDLECVKRKKTGFIAGRFFDDD